MRYVKNAMDPGIADVNPNPGSPGIEHIAACGRDAEAQNCQKLTIFSTSCYSISSFLMR